MPFIPTADTARVAVEMRLDGQEIINTLWFTLFGGFTLETLDQLAAIVAVEWGDNIMPQLSEDLSLVAVTATDQESATAPSFTEVIAPPVAGGIEAESEPNSVAACVTFLTSQRGRGGRGRNYLAGVPSVAVVNNTLASTFMNNIIAAYEEMNTVWAAQSFNHAIVSFQEEGAPTFIAGVPKLVTGYRFADATVDSQRRRLPGRGQ
jgi:hypothetical protein